MAETPNHPGRWVSEGSFSAELHFYPRAQNAQIHPLVSYFLQLDNECIIKRYCHLHPIVNEAALRKLLTYKPVAFRWAGADLFNVTTADGQKKIIVIETNSCPSGQKSMPLVNEQDDQAGYHQLMAHTIKPLLEESAAANELEKGCLAVIYDKNIMEASGYAASMADVFKERVLLVEWYHDDSNPSVKYNKDTKLIEVFDGKEWHPVRAAFRYVTQKPWNRLPVSGGKTLVFNPITVCLAGGRNKAIAAKAYDFFNADQKSHNTGIEIRIPETIWDVSKSEIPLWVHHFGGMAVIKIPYSNAGQGVFTITSKQELEVFMSKSFSYESFIVQSLVGNYRWTSVTREGQFFHVGTVPDKKMDIYVCDMRMMVHYNSTKGQFAPMVVYARRAHAPLTDSPPHGNSWEMLGTNLSVKKDAHAWDTETNRLLLMDRKDFNRLGIGLDELIEGYIQTVCSVIAIDKMTKKLTSSENFWDQSLFSGLNKDVALNNEVLQGINSINK